MRPWSISQQLEGSVRPSPSDIEENRRGRYILFRVCTAPGARLNTTHRRTEVAMQQSSISYSWRKPDASRGFTSGVSLHSHTCMSKETLSHVADMGTKYKLLRPIFANRERYCREVHGYELNYRASYWTPPLSPLMAFDLERRQIEDQLQLTALVSITDHDDRSEENTS